MKSYIQDLCGDEDTVVIDVAILNCLLQDAIYRVLAEEVNEETDASDNCGYRYPGSIKYVTASYTLED